LFVQLFTAMQKRCPNPNRDLYLYLRGGWPHKRPPSTEATSWAQCTTLTDLLEALANFKGRHQWISPTVTFSAENWCTSYTCPGEHSHGFWFSMPVHFHVTRRSPYRMDRIKTSNSHSFKHITSNSDSVHGVVITALRMQKFTQFIWYYSTSTGWLQILKVLLQ